MRILFNVDSFVSFFNSHSNTSITFHPKATRAASFFSSLALFFIIFSVHHSVLVLGMEKYLQFSCPCQKQPCTKMTVLYFGSTMSGFPGSFLSYNLYRSPFENKNFLTTISGLVSLPLMRLML